MQDGSEFDGNVRHQYRTLTTSVLESSNDWRDAAYHRSEETNTGVGRHTQHVDAERDK